MINPVPSLLASSTNDKYDDYVEGHGKIKNEEKKVL